MTRSLRLIVALLVLVGCTQRVGADRIAAYASALNARTARIVIPEGEFAAVSAVEDRGDASVLRTTIRGRNRNAIGLAVGRFYATARSLSAEMGIPCDTGGGFDTAAMAWNGSAVECSLVTVAFARAAP